MTRDDFLALLQRLRASWDNHVTLDKRDVQRLLDEIRWTKRRLRRIETAIQPLADDLRRK